jgi:hypothetical protein
MSLANDTEAAAAQENKQAVLTGGRMIGLRPE